MWLQVPDICRLLNSQYPEFEGRIIATSSDDIDFSDMPYLPLIKVTSQGIRVDNHDFNQGINSRIRMFEGIEISLWQSPKRAENSALTQNFLPFWSYIDYIPFMDKILTALLDNTIGAKFALRSVDVTSDNIASIISIKLQQNFIWKACKEESAILKCA